MKLDAIQEQEMIERFDRVVWKVVHRFASRAQLGMTCTKDDLHQEGLIVLLQHIRNADNDESLKRLPVMDMWNAMSRLVLEDQPISIPSTRTADFRKLMETLEEMVDFSDTACKSVEASSIEECEARLMIDSFVHNLNDLDQDIMALKIAGMTRAEVSRALNLPKCRVSRHIKTLAQKYADFSAA